jgi:hypothetical protein
MQMGAGSWRGAGAGFFYWDAFLAQGAEIGGPGRYFERCQGYFRDAQVGSASAAVDDGAGSQNFYAFGLEGFDDVAGAAAGGDDILNDDGGFAGLHGESAAEDHFRGRRVAFGEQEACAQGSGDFVADDQASDGGGNHDVTFREMRGQFAAEGFGNGGMLKHQRALHIFVGMKAAGEAEMTLQISAGFAKFFEDGVGHGNKIACCRFFIMPRVFRV